MAADRNYLAAQRDDFREYFEQNHVQLALTTGDMVFFSPAVFHAAGDTTMIMTVSQTWCK